MDEQANHPAAKEFQLAFSIGTYDSYQVKFLRTSQVYLPINAFVTKLNLT